MLKEQPGTSIDLPHPVAAKPLESGHCEIVRDVCADVDRSRLGQLTLSHIDAFWRELNAVLSALECLPETSFQALIEVILCLREARNELRLARFLFDVKEINPTYRLVMRNRAVWRGNEILHKVLQVWPLQSSPEIPFENVS